MNTINEEKKLKKTPLFSCHEQLGATMVPFAGTLLPLKYTSEKSEHMAVRKSVGIFDVSHMGEFIVEGPDAKAFLLQCLSNNVEKLSVGEAQYTLMLNPLGGIIDDLIVYRLTDSKYLLCVNAANVDKDFAWLSSIHPLHDDFTLRNESDAYAQIAVQGPNALALLAQMVNEPVLASFKIGTFTLKHAALGPVIIAFTGYTGEDGAEIFVQPKDAPGLWELLLHEGQKFDIKACGLAARDSLRTEAGLWLYGQDLTEAVSPLKANLMFAVDLSRDSFIGRDALIQEKIDGVRERLVGFKLLEKGVPRPDYIIEDEHGKSVGRITSAAWPENQVFAVAMGFLAMDVGMGSKVFIKIRDHKIASQVVPLKGLKISTKPKIRKTVI